jgi:DNA-binding NarL/FixJ family response regulator
MLVEGLCCLINDSTVAKVIGTSYSLAECRKALVKLPDVLLLDLNLPDGNGVDFCIEIRKKYPNLKILVLTTYNEYSIARQVLVNGASGYILKNALSEEVIVGIEAVMNGEVFLCEEIDILMKKKKEEPIWLTNRERELLRFIADGYSNQEIADKIFLSVETVKTYRKNLILKLGAKNSMMLVKIAIEKQFIINNFQ